MQTLIPVEILAILFFGVATVYAIAGLGGASTYLALLVLAGASLHDIAPVALACNVLVTAGSVCLFAREGLLPVRLIAPFVAFSVPAAFAGGTVRLAEPVLKVMLALCLFAAGIHLLRYDRFRLTGTVTSPAPARLWVVACIAGTAIGFLSGMVGIGGGIFLAPTLYVLRWLEARQVAAASSLFILVNSVAGLVGHAARAQVTFSMTAALPLFVGVLLGGIVGSLFSARHLKPVSIRLITALLVLFASMRLAWTAIW